MRQLVTADSSGTCGRVATFNFLDRGSPQARECRTCLSQFPWMQMAFIFLLQPASLQKFDMHEIETHRYERILRTAHATGL